MNGIGNWGKCSRFLANAYLSAVSPRSRDISFSTNYFSFSFIYFILLSEQYSFLILSMALRSQ